MDEQKKQKVLIAVLAVVALGAGSYYFMRDTGGPARRVTQGGKTERKKRASAADTTRKPTRAKRVKAREQVAGAQRKEREERTRQTSHKKRRRGSQRKERKKKISPAA